VADPIEIIEGLRGVQEGIGEFVRNGPSTGLPGYVRDKYRERCRQFANLPAWARLLGNGPLGTMDRICRPYWDDNGWDGPEVAPAPFTGGQCPGKRYEVSSEIVNPAGTVFNSGTIVFVGPLGAPSFGEVSPGRYELRMTTGGTTTSFPAPCSSITSTTTADRLVRGVTSAPGQTFTGRVTSVTVCASDGADNCGDPPPEFPIRPGPNPPPDPGPVGGPVPTDNPENPTGPPLIPIPPYQDPIYGPIPIVGPTGPPGGGTPPPPPGDIGDPGSPSDTGVGGEAEGEAPAGSILVGLRIDVLASPPKARQFAPGVFRAACYIYMGAASNLDQDYGGSMLKSGQFFFAEKENLTHWLVSANTGYNHRVTPYYREVEE